MSGTIGPSHGIQDHLPGQVITDTVRIGDGSVRRYSAELWTSGQRKASSIHEISYRACFKPQLAAFFIERFSEEGDLVYDPFGGRGTTVIEAGLLGRRVVQNDINPLSVLLTKPRFFVPTEESVSDRLSRVPRDSWTGHQVSTFQCFTIRQPRKRSLPFVNSLRDTGDRTMMTKSMHGSEWSQRTGSPGIQAVSFRYIHFHQTRRYLQDAQAKINIKRQQVPPYRDTHEIILKKTRTLTRNLTVY